MVLLLGGFVLARELDRGWVPHDEGALGQSAERVLHGEVPHRDFDEIYTGLLSYVNAIAFRFGGIRANTLRIPLFLFALTWLAALYRIARRFIPPIGAGIVALACFMYSVPNYRAAVPSWYILFFATFGTLALVRWHETRHRRWLLVAGAAGGVAILFKLSGVFYTLGGVLALVAASTTPAHVHPTSLSLRHVHWMISLVLLGTVLVLAGIVAGAGGNALFRFVVPFSLVASAAIVREWNSGGDSGSERLRALASTLGPFLIGVGIPLACFFLPFVVAGGGTQLLLGTFVTPFRRLESASMQPPPPNALLWSLPVVWTLWPRRVSGSTRLTTSIAIFWFGVVIASSGVSHRYYQAGLLAAWSIPVLVALAVALMSLASRTGHQNLQHRETALTIGIVAMCSLLVEFPFAAPIYTLYALPMAMLALACIVRAWGRTPVRSQMIVALFFLVFAYVRLIPGTIWSLGTRFLPHQETTALTLPRASLRVLPEDAFMYDSLISFVQSKATGRTMWAGPDAPEVYFLSGIQNRTRTLFEFLDRSPEAALPLLPRLDRLGASLVVLKLEPEFSPHPSPTTIATLRAAYPNSTELPGFLVLWR
ncbi:MAG: glycosyltransferase family 39 protein [Gemmatimonadota bacterium]